jgi:hypothetical protein
LTGEAKYKGENKMERFQISPDRYNPSKLARFDHLDISSKDGKSEIQFFTHTTEYASKEEKVRANVRYLKSFARRNNRDVSQLNIVGIMMEEFDY